MWISQKKSNRSTVQLDHVKSDGEGSEFLDEGNSIDREPRQKTARDRVALKCTLCDRARNEET
jgi:hypothetical protein